ncbi:hypothetical protein [Sphingobacterium chuzhouense]|uniref:Uncharacterized protein n=1 Tax=Sphingobacterium chuzhouense TaxID=1742264 RepID=A0ABR7XXK6_9SPHI|nr:hypothetical protein [Sphingobacterium chuzhouense]MBD1423782.1 hypothetical protein [Sphingobacterium chuzhouense]
MEVLTYAMLMGLGLVFIFFLVRNEQQKYQRYKRLIDMDVEVQFQESADPYDHMRRGSVMLRLHGCEEHVKAIVIKDMSFNHRAFYVPSLDNKLYFKGKGTENQLLSASFRIRRHALRQLVGKQVYVNLSGWVSDNEGNAKPFKARVPYTVACFSDNETAINMTALT